MTRNIFLTLLCLSALSAPAQILTVNFPDTTDCSKSELTIGKEKGQNEFDARRLKAERKSPSTLVVDNVELKDMDFAPAWIYLDNASRQFIVEPGKTLEIDVTRDSNGDCSFIFKGDNARAAEYLKAYNEYFDIGKYFPFENDTVPTDVKQAEIDNNYAALKRDLDKVSDGKVKEFLKRLTDDAYLNFRVRLCGSDQKKAAILLDTVDLNSWIGLYNYLPVWAFESKLETPDFDADMTPWGLAYIKAIGEKITDPDVRKALLNNCALQVLEWGQCNNVDDFWLPFVEFAYEDSPVVKYYANKVKSLKSTRAGMKAIDINFTDADGKPHKLSDFFGKVIYIDVWASWCGPCRKEIPHIARHYTEYYKGNDKVMFLSISVDEDENAWKKAMEKDKPLYSQFRASGEDHQALTDAYGIGGIPRFMVINADGTIYNADAFRPSDEDFRKKLDAAIK